MNPLVTKKYGHNFWACLSPQPPTFQIQIGALTEPTDPWLLIRLQGQIQETLLSAFTIIRVKQLSLWPHAIKPGQILKRPIFLPVQLQNHQITYRWGFPFCLSASKDGIQYCMRDLYESEVFIQNQGLPPIPEEDLQLPTLTSRPLLRFGPRHINDRRELLPLLKGPPP